MFGLSPLATLAVIWAAVTFVLAGLVLYRTLISNREDDQLFLDQTDSQLEQEQKAVITKLNHITPFTKGFAAVSVLLAFAMGGLWLYEALTRQLP
jgi:Tfp pilus assembly protein PilN